MHELHREGLKRLLLRHRWLEPRGNDEPLSLARCGLPYYVLGQQRSANTLLLRLDIGHFLPLRLSVFEPLEYLRSTRMLKLCPSVGL